MRPDPSPGRLRDAFRRHERKGVVLYLGAVAILVASVAVPSFRDFVFARLESLVVRWDNRLVPMVAYGEALLQAGEYERAAEYLAALEKDFPARNVRHRLDKERERILVALGRSYLELGRKGATLDTYRRLVAFDPLNFMNHLALAMACEHFEEPEEAQLHFGHILSKHPSHLPSLRSVVSQSYTGGDFASVVSRYEGYLDAFLVQPVFIDMGDTLTIRVPVDGRWHDLELPVSLPSKWTGELLINPGGFPTEVMRVAVGTPIVVGSIGRDSTVLLDGNGGSANPAVQHSGSAIKIFVSPLANPVVAIHLRLRLFKPVDPSLWEMVRLSYQNRLESARMAQAISRTVVLASSEVADRITVPLD